MKKRIGRPLVSVTACNLVFVPSLVRNDDPIAALHRAQKVSDDQDGLVFWQGIDGRHGLRLGQVVECALGLVKDDKISIMIERFGHADARPTEQIVCDREDTAVWCNKVQNDVFESRLVADSRANHPPGVTSFGATVGCGYRP